MLRNAGGVRRQARRPDAVPERLYLRGNAVGRVRGPSNSTSPDGSTKLVEMTDAVELPYPTYAAVCLPDQVQVHPMEVLAALARSCALPAGS